MLYFTYHSSRSAGYNPFMATALPPTRFIEPFLNQLEDRDKEVRKTAMKELLGSLDLSVTQFAAELGVSKQTAYGWISGSFTPRKEQLEKMRRRWSVSTRPILVEDSDARRMAGIWTKRDFLKRTSLCAKVLMFKDCFELLAGESPSFRDDVVRAIENRKTELYYIFIGEDSTARRSLLEFVPVVNKQYSEQKVSHRMFIIDAFKWSDKDERATVDFGQNKTPASPFLFLYNEDGQDEYSKEWDVMFEIPTQKYDFDGRREADRDEDYLWIELPKRRANGMYDALTHVLDKPKVSFADYDLTQLPSDNRPR